MESAKVVYVVYSKDMLDDYCSVYVKGVYESKEEAKREAEKCGGWSVDCEFFRKPFTKQDFESWRERASKLGTLGDRVKQLAQVLGVGTLEGRYNVSNLLSYEDIVTVNGTPWVSEEDFLKIIKGELD